jgi:hypothetical protein
MKTQQFLLNKDLNTSIVQESQDFSPDRAQLVLAFGQRTLLEAAQPYATLKNKFPQALIILCSSSGQISNQVIIENDIVVTAILFEKTQLKSLEYDVLKADSIRKLGKKVQEELVTPDLQAILLLSEGTYVNGSELIQELTKQTNGKIPFFGGLAGDEFSFEKTIVGLNADAQPGKIVAVGFYGEGLKFGFASEGGWADFGPEREVTHSNKNVLYRIGDRNALELYKDYLGKYADELPGSALYFPLSMKENPDSEPVVRTILAIDEHEKSMTFAGNIPLGSRVRFMRGNIDKLIDAAANAALHIRTKLPYRPQIAFLVSCVGRRVVLAERVDEELEFIKQTFGDDTVLFGFYSYGEISPDKNGLGCELHNQTMTIAALFEA